MLYNSRSPLGVLPRAMQLQSGTTSGNNKCAMPVQWPRHLTCPATAAADPWVAGSLELLVTQPSTGQQQLWRTWLGRR
jgi:hypothetical protein